MMPGLDRQGPPQGDGNQSGRRMGKCNPDYSKDTEQVKEYGQGRGLGRGRGIRNGMGRGKGNRNL